MLLSLFQRCILDIDVQGARSVRARTIEAIFIFIRPPSFEELEKRLRDRYCFSPFFFPEALVFLNLTIHFFFPLFCETKEELKLKSRYKRG